MAAVAKIPVIKVQIKGLFKPLVDTTAWSPVYTGFVKPLAVNKANSTLSLHGIAAVVEKLQVDTAAQIEYRNLYNFEGVQVTLEDGKVLSADLLLVAVEAHRDAREELVHRELLGASVLLVALETAHQEREVLAPSVAVLAVELGERSCHADVLEQPLRGRDEALARAEALACAADRADDLACALLRELG